MSVLTATLTSPHTDCYRFYVLVLTGGLQALIAVAVIVAIAAIPIVYIFIRKRQNKPVIPDKLRSTVGRVMPCCAPSKGNILY